MIPQELRLINRWLCWKYAEGKKKPIDPKTGKYASVTNPSTWSTFEQAVKVHNRYNGIGIVLDGSDGLIGVDLDHTSLDAARPIVEALDSYTEYSPSGNGIRIFIKADVALDRGNRQDGIEVYQSGRFLTVTGNVILQKGVEQRTEQFRQWYELTFKAKQKEVSKQGNVSTNNQPIDDLDDDLLLQRIFEYDQYGDEHEQRFNGIQPTSDNNDRSLTDYRLAQAFCRWTKDYQRAITLMLKSKLARAKWFETRGNETWIEQCVGKALFSVQ